MADLRAIFADLGYQDGQTVLQSGNVVFTASSPLVADAAAQVEAMVGQRTGVHAAVLLVPVSQFLAVADENPLLEVATDPSLLLVTFLAEPPDRAHLQEPDAAASAPEVLRVGTRAIYQWCPDGVLASRVPASFWRQLGPLTTARNWRTVTRLVNHIR